MEVIYIVIDNILSYIIGCNSAKLGYHLPGFMPEMIVLCQS